METVTHKVAARPRDYVRVAGPDAEDFLQRMLSNDVGSAPCEALLLTPKGRVIAPVVIVPRREGEFLLLTEPGLGEAVVSTLLRARFAAKVEIAPEEHRSAIVFGEGRGIPTAGYGAPAVEVIDGELEPTLSDEELERLRIEAGTPVWGKEIDGTILPAEAGLERTHVSFTKGCYPGQEPIARLHNRGKVNRRLRVLDVDGANPGDEILLEEKVVGRITSAVPGRALAYLRTEVPDDAELAVGVDRKTARALPA